MANAKRPGIPADSTKDTANTNQGKMVHDNMAPFKEAPANSGEDVIKKYGPDGLPEEGTGRC